MAYIGGSAGKFKVGDGVSGTAGGAHTRGIGKKDRATGAKGVDLTCRECLPAGPAVGRGSGGTAGTAKKVPSERISDTAAKTVG